jgi:hypothetical protein
MPDSFRHYFTGFVGDEHEMLGSAPPLPWNWFVRNIPWLDTPDQELNEIYYFRGYAFQKHIERTPDGYLITEFLDDVPWAGKFNTIDAAAGHHIREARWLRDPEYVDDYTRFWFGPDGEPRRYSFWAADSVYQLYLATGNRQLAISLLPALEKNYSAWESTHQDSNGHSASGWSGVRELIGYIPWCFDIPPPQHDVAWKFLFAPEGFGGRYRPTTAERSSPRFRYKVNHECLWNGPSWPYATTQTLVALANLLNGPKQTVMTEADYFPLLSTCTHSQHIRLPDDE